MSHIHWLYPFQPNTFQDVHNANLASIRLRLGAFIAALPSNHELNIGPLATSKSDILIIGKLGAKGAQEFGQNWIRQMQGLRSRGTKVVLDYTDDHLTYLSELTPFYQEALLHIDLAVCSSPLLAINLSRSYTGPIEVIPDAIEVPLISTKLSLQSETTALWFGHLTNLQFLIDFLPNLATSRPLRLIVLSNIEALQRIKANPYEIPDNVQTMCAIWSASSMLEAARISDFCIIPSERGNSRKAAVSSNRLLTALALGLPTAADRMDSYLEFSDYFTDIRSPDFHKLLENPLAFTSKIGQIQGIIANKYSLEKIGMKWMQLMHRLVGSNI